MQPSEQEQQDKQLGKIEQLKRAYVSTFSTTSGKKVLEDLKNKCFVNKTTYSDKRGEIYFNEGMRYVLVHIENMMNFNITKLKELIQKGEN